MQFSNEIIIGMDEVGRGAWAGPLVVGAVSLNKPINGLKDSKIISKKVRESLSKDIYKHANFVNLGWVSSAEIDKYGLSKALFLAYERAMPDIKRDCRVIIDGSINYLPSLPKVECLIKADQIVPEVSAASIVAKVARDKYMFNLGLKNPEYGFDKHVGYGTAIHSRKIKNYGTIEEHRLSFKPLLGYL